jgi:SPP1 gp7 family putative phage head morphogenesis protein
LDKVGIDDPTNNKLVVASKDYQDEVLNTLAFTLMQGYWIERQAIQPALRNEFIHTGTLDKYGQLKLFAKLDLYQTLFSTHLYKYVEPEAVLPFEEALEYFADLIPTLVGDLTAEDSELLEQLISKSFFVTRSTNIETTRKLYNLLEEAFIDGIGFNTWLNNNEDVFNRLGFDTENPYYLENVFRTNGSLSYSAGQYKQQTDPAVAAVLDNWQYYNIGDARSRPSHKAMSGIIRPSNDPFWNTNYPPNGFQCRCTVIIYSKRMMRTSNLRLTSENSPRLQIKADEGWQTNQAATYYEAA